LKISLRDVPDGGRQDPGQRFRSAKTVQPAGPLRTIALALVRIGGKRASFARLPVRQGEQANTSPNGGAPNIRDGPKTVKLLGAEAVLHRIAYGVGNGH
jgi:hypothetical protein